MYGAGPSEEAVLAAISSELPITLSLPGPGGPPGQADGCWCPGASMALPSRAEGARGTGDPRTNPQGHRES